MGNHNAENAMSWRDFWNGEHSIYVSERHRLLHYRQIAADIAAHVPTPDAVVLDHGCGEALSADAVARACGRLYLCEAAPNVREKLAQRFAREPKIAVLAPEDVTALPAGSLDLVVANSLAQDLSRSEFAALLLEWRGKLKPGGRLILADIIPPDQSALADTGALLSFAWRGGFLFAALGGLVRTAFSDYRRLRAQYGLATYAPEAVMLLLEQAGYEDIGPTANFGHNQRRMAFTATAPGQVAPTAHPPSHPGRSEAESRDPS